MNSQMHWESVYRTKAPNTVSWYAAHLLLSMHYVRMAAPGKDASIIDVGGGESTLVDDLLAEGYDKLAVLDISPRALEITRHRLGPRADEVNWLTGDVLDIEFPVGVYDVWHDRAVFHFLTSPEQRHRYVEQVLKALKPGGWAIVGTFGPEGPEKCSGLPVARYDPNTLHRSFGEPFQLVDSRIEVHQTPWGTPQQFVYCLCRRPAQQLQRRHPVRATLVGPYPRDAVESAFVELSC